MTTPKDRAELLDLLVKADATASVYSTHIQQEESRLATLKAAGLAVVPVEPTNEMLSVVPSATWEVYQAMLAASPYREDKP